VLLTTTKGDGAVETTTLTLRDVPGRQDLSLGVSDVVRVRLTVQTAFGATPRTRIALAEVAFFKRS